MHQRRGKSDESAVDQLGLFQDMHKSNANHAKGNEKRVLKMSAIHASIPNCSKHHSHGPSGSSANDLEVCGQAGEDPLEASIQSHRRSCGSSKKVLLGRSSYIEEKEEDLLTTLELGEHDYDWLMSAPTLSEKDCESHSLNVRHNLPSKSRYFANPSRDEEPSSRANGSTKLFKSSRITSGVSLSGVIDLNTSSKRLMVGSKSISRPTSPTRQRAIMASLGSLSRDVTPTRISKGPSKTLGMSSPKLVASNSSDVVVSKSSRTLPKTISKLPSVSLMGRSRNITSGDNSPSMTKPHQATCAEVEAKRKSSVSKSSISSSSMTRTGMRHSLITQCETSQHDPSRKPLVSVAPRGQASLADEKEGTGKSCISWNNGNLRSKSNEMASGNNMDTRVKSLIQAHKMIASSPSFEPENISNLQMNPLLASNVGYGRSRSIDISMDPFQTFRLRGIPMHHIGHSSSNISFTSMGRFAHGLQMGEFGEQFLHGRESKQDMLTSCINRHHVNNDWISNGGVFTIPHELPRVTEIGSVTESSHHVCQHASGNLHCDLCDVKFRLRELNKKTRVNFVQASS